MCRRSGKYANNFVAIHSRKPGLFSPTHFFPSFLFLITQQKNNINSIKMIEYTPFILIVMPLWLANLMFFFSFAADDNLTSVIFHSMMCVRVRQSKNVVFVEFLWEGVEWNSIISWMGSKENTFIYYLKGILEKEKYWLVKKIKHKEKFSFQSITLSFSSLPRPIILVQSLHRKNTTHFFL